MEAFQIPRWKVSRYFGVARSTPYRRPRKIEDQKPSDTLANKTPTEINSLVWEITQANLSWGRIRIANQLQLLGVFLSASTVRNILQRPRPRNTPAAPATPEKTQEKPESRAIPAWYPNHVWSIDTTKVWCWGLWPIQVLVAIDHFARKVVRVVPLEGPNAGWIIEALEQALQKHGAPKHIISDQAGVFGGDAVAVLLSQWNVKPRLGAVGKHGSISLTERVIKTLKYEWLRCVPLIKGLDHLTLLCTQFENWYNTWPPHMSSKVCGRTTCITTASLRGPNGMQRPSPAISNVTSSPKDGSPLTASRTPRSLLLYDFGLVSRGESAHLRKADR